MSWNARECAMNSNTASYREYDVERLSSNFGTLGIRKTEERKMFFLLFNNVIQPKTFWVFSNACIIFANTHANVGGKTFGPVAWQFRNDGQVVEFRLERRKRFVIGARHCLVEF